MSEECFPRGGTSTTPQGKRKKDKEEKLEKDLFEDTNDGEAIKKRKIPKQKQRAQPSSVKIGKDKGKKIKKEKEKGIEDQIHQLNAENVQGMLILGIIREIQDYELIVNLPYDLSGTVKITNISNAYRDMLQKLTEGDSSVVEGNQDFGTLHEMFRVGQPVRCKVLDQISHQNIKKKTAKHKLNLTINPKDVNENVQAACLSSGMTLSGCVSSKEDHGYLIDIGVPGVTAFLKYKQAETYIKDTNNGKPLKIGQYLECMIKGSKKGDCQVGNSRTVNVAVDIKKVSKAAIKMDSKIPMNSLLPGMLVEGKVEQVKANGLHVKFQQYNSYLNIRQMEESTEKYKPEELVKAAILFIEPITKKLVLTQRTHLINSAKTPKKLFGEFDIGSVIKEAEVIKVLKSGGVLLKLDEKITGFANKGQLSDQDIKDVYQKFPKGSKHTCRVLNFNYADNVAQVTLKQSILNENFMKVTDVQPGSIVECKVTDVTGKGVRVNLAPTIRGFISSIHTADVPLRHPEKKIKIGNSLKCRVLTVNKEKKKVVLCNKKTLVRSEFPVITDLNQCSVGLILEGFVALVNDKGILVVFYNDVKGWVPKSKLSIEREESPEKQFFVGQVVRCMVIDCQEDKGKLVLSLKLNEKGKAAKKKEIELPENFEIGKILKCKLIKKTDRGFEVTLQPSGIAGFLPKKHLSDHTELNNLLHTYFKPGDTLDEVIYISKTNTVIVSNKLSLKEAENNGSSIKEFDQLKPGLIVHGTVKKLVSYGLFVALSSRLAGLVPTKYACDRIIKDVSTIYKEGDSCVAKVTEIDKEKMRFLLSMRMDDCYFDDTNEGLRILEDYLQYYNKIISNLKNEEGETSKLSAFKIGELMKSITVTNVNDNGVLCDLHNGVKGFATSENMAGVVCKTGDKVEAVVLYVDPVVKCVELSLHPELVKYVKNLKDDKFTKAKVGQTMNSVVHLVKKDFILVSLRGHAVGRMAFMPAKRLFNDVFEYRTYGVGQTNKVVVKQVLDNGQLLVGLNMHESDRKRNKGKEVTGHNLKLGDIVEAVVQTVHDNQLNIRVGEAHGRVHSTEIDDDIQDGTNPVKKFKEGQVIKAKIIGLRDIKTHRYLPISHPNRSKSLIDCSLKPSTLAVPGLQDGESVEEKAYKVGDTVQAVVKEYNHCCLWMHITPTLSGKVYVLNISEDAEILGDPMSHFKVGCIYKATVIGQKYGSIQELSLIGAPKKLKSNCITTGQIISLSNQQGLTIKLTDRFIGKASLSDLWDDYRENPVQDFKMDQFVKCCVIGLNKQQKNKCVLSLRKSRCLAQPKGKKTDINVKKDKEVRTVNNLKEGEVLRGYVVNCNKHGVFVNIGTDVTGRAEFKNVIKEYITEPEEIFKVGKVVTVKILKIEKGSNHVDLSLLEDDTGVNLNIPENHVTKNPVKKMAAKRKNSESSESEATLIEDKKRKVQKKASDVDEVDSGVDVESEGIIKSAKIQPRLTLDAGFTWSDTFELPETNGTTLEDGSSDDDSETDGTETKPKGPISREQKLQQLKQQAQVMYQRERDLLNPERVPQTAEDFDRLVLQSPDSSIVWLRYMAFCLESCDQERARAVAERALQTISFREEQEKLNIWVAYMNLENMYGTYESLMEVFKRAVKRNEPLKVYTQLIAIFVASEKYDQAEQLYNTVMKKFGQNKDVWTNFGLFYFKSYTKPELARKVMERSFKSLEKKEHVEVINKFAQLEFKYGEPERGKSMFENLLNLYPRRTDLWSVYIDMVTKINQQEARELYERLINSNLPVKKMKFCFKKYLEFEQKYGTEDNVDAVKQKAIEYVDVNV